MLRLAVELLAGMVSDHGPRDVTEDEVLADLKARAEEGSGDDEYPECEDCRNTGHPWTECAEQGMSGSDYRYFCDCEQGRDMKAARAKEGSKDE